MKNNVAEHFSNHFELKLDKIPTHEADRMSALIYYIGSFLGLALVVLGSYEFFNGMLHPVSAFSKGMPEGYEPLVSPAFFDVTIILIGLGIIFSLLGRYLQYKKIYFDGKNIRVVKRLANGKKIKFNEPLSKYTGVRFRIEFAQLGFLSRNHYIIELLHKNPEKIVPLFITYRKKNIRRIWEYYSRTLGLPAVIMTDEGPVSRKIENLDKSIKELVQMGILKNDFDESLPRPKNVELVRKSDKTVLKNCKIVWDAYNILVAVLIACAAGLLAYMRFINPELSQKFHENGELTFAIVIGIIIFLTGLILFKKDKIVIKKYKIVKVHKFFGFSRKDDEMAKMDIEAIVVTENPATGRFYVAIISDEKTIIFGKKLPIEDLRWTKNFLMHELTK